MIARSMMRLTAAALMLCTSAAALAHHSYAMFDRVKVVSISGQVKLWELINPHSYLWVYVKNEQTGKYDLWGLEAPGPTQLTRAGWTKSTVKPGDKVSLTLNPLKDGRNGGNLLSITLADGRHLEGFGGPPPAGKELHD
jgi:hypothetical protein